MSDSRDGKGDRREELIRSFRDRETREGYSEGFLHTWIASQLAAVRMQRGLTQKELAKMIGTQQPGIARMERDGYGKWNLATLANVAQTLGCHLKVSLETYGSLVEEAVAFRSTEFLKRPSFEEDPVFLRDIPPKELHEPGPIAEMRRKVLRWLDNHAPIDQLETWLQGYDLPPVGDEEPPSYWILAGFLPSEEKEQPMLVRRLRSCMERRADGIESGIRKPDTLDANLFDLVAKMPRPLEFSVGLDANYKRLRGRSQSRLTRSRAGLALLNAIMHNQESSHFFNVWKDQIEEADLEAPYRDFSIGLRGLARIPGAPNAHEVTLGSQITAYTLRPGVRKSVFVKSLADAYRDVWREFRSTAPMFPDDVLKHLREEGGAHEWVMNALMLSLSSQVTVREPYTDNTSYWERKWLEGRCERQLRAA